VLIPRAFKASSIWCNEVAPLRCISSDHREHIGRMMVCYRLEGCHGSLASLSQLWTAKRHASGFGGGHSPLLVMTSSRRQHHDPQRRQQRRPIQSLEREPPARRLDQQPARAGRPARSVLKVRCFRPGARCPQNNG
jgi:hypothetical protein